MVGKIGRSVGVLDGGGVSRTSFVRAFRIKGRATWSFERGGNPSPPPGMTALRFCPENSSSCGTMKREKKSALEKFFPFPGRKTGEMNKRLLNENH